MVSFARLWEQIDKEKARRSPLMQSGESDRALVVVRTGKEMHGEDQTPFWDEFVSLCNNAQGMAQLLGVDQTIVSNWPSKIYEALDKLEKHQTPDPTEEEESELMPTGDNGAVTPNITPSNSDPTNIGDVQ